jgi:hypothetical protein
MAEVLNTEKWLMVGQNLMNIRNPRVVPGSQHRAHLQSINKFVVARSAFGCVNSNRSLQTFKEADAGHLFNEINPFPVH